ncbi:ribonuclease H-like domain-containing protein [Tanacetum coccineum]
MWLFRHKYLADGTLSRYKEHLVANGSTQLEGVDVDETFSSVVKPGTIRTILSLAASRHCPIHQLNVKNDFLHGDLFETDYMHQPPRFWDSVHPDYVCLLQRQGTDTAYLLLYVDDIVLISSSKSSLQQIIRSLHQEFAMKDLGPLNYFLGISVTCDSSGLFLSQKKYAIEILDRAHMDNYIPIRTPIDTESKLGSDGVSSTLQGTDTAYLLLYVDDIVLTACFESFLQQIIRSLHQEFAMTDLGLLNYFLGISVTRDSIGLFLSQKKYDIEILDRAHMDNCNPNRTPIDTESKLGSDVQQVCLYMHDPREPHFSAFKRILRYVRGTLDYGLQLFSFSTSDLVAYSDADWAGCPTTRRSTLGYCVFLSNNLISWSSKRQPTLSCSSAEAKYRGVANVVAETCWLRNLLRELHTPLSSATLVYCDNVSAVNLSCNLVQHQRTKHIEIDIHFVRDLVAAGHVRVLHVPSRYQFANIFTKGLPSTLFEEFRSSLSVR